MPAFNGFSKELIEFFSRLSISNSKEWFDSHKKEYEQYVKQPSMEFVLAVGDKLRKLIPEINAIPKVNKSLFRVNRDVRFSKDKSPYKTNMGIWFWEGEGKRMECPGFYFHLEADKLMLGAGYYIFPKHLIAPYRDAVVGDISGPLLQKTAKVLEKNDYILKGQHYKRIPNGYDANHLNANYLLHNGLHTGVETILPEEFFSSDLIEYTLERFKKMQPLHEWLKNSVGAV